MPPMRTFPTCGKSLDGDPPANSAPVRVMQEPGEAYSYSGGGYMVVMQLLEDMTGRPFADLMQELVLDKLDMAHSTFAQSGALCGSWVMTISGFKRRTNSTMPVSLVTKHYIIAVANARRCRHYPAARICCQSNWSLL
jgi:CubicO group peptidase (beta-lactamase class C family)